MTSGPVRGLPPHLKSSWSGSSRGVAESFGGRSVACGLMPPRGRLVGRSQDHDLAGRVVEQPGDVVGAEARRSGGRRRRRRCGRSARASSSSRSAWRYGAAALDAGVDGDAGGASRAARSPPAAERRACTGAGSGASSGSAIGTGARKAGTSVALLGAREPQRGVERRARERVPTNGNRIRRRRRRRSSRRRRRRMSERDGEARDEPERRAAAPRSSCASLRAWRGRRRSAGRRRAARAAAGRRAARRSGAGRVRGARRAHQHVGRAALARDLRRDVGDVVALARRAGARRAARRAGAARRAARARSSVGLAGEHDPEHVELGAEPLGRAPRAAHDRCELGCGLTSASSRSPTACGAARAIRRSSRGATVHVAAAWLDLLGDLAQRDLAQRGEVLDPEEAVERGLDALGRVDLAGAQARRSAPRA